MSTSELSVTALRMPADDCADAVALRLRFLPATSRAEAMFMWRKLEVELCNQRLACSSVWTETWLNHYGSLIPHQFVVGTRGGTICGMALMTRGIQQNAGPIHLNTWHVGTAGEPEADSVCVEYNTLLTRPNDSIDFAHALWNWARTETNCDEFRMDGFEAAAMYPLLTQIPQVVVERKSAYFFDLALLRVKGEAPLMRLGSHTRSNIRRTLRDLGEIRLEWAETVDQAVSLFHQMVVLHQARWNAAGSPGVYASRRFHDFHLDLLSRALPLGMMTVFGVKAGDQLVGCNQLPIDGRRVQIYQSGRISTTRRVSYGMVLDYLCICESLRRGYETVEFLAGEGEHKRRLSTDRGELAWICWRRPSIKNTTIDALRCVKHATTRLTRSDPPPSQPDTKPATEPVNSELEGDMA
jgi:hypothetical protein